MPADSPDNLNGQTILVPRPAPPAGQTDKLADLLESVGASVIAHPVIELVTVPLERISEQLEQLDQFKTIVFVSATGVRFFTALLHQHGKSGGNKDLRRQLTELKIAAIGPGSAAEIEKLGLPVHYVPDNADSESLSNGLIRSMDEPFLIIRADRGSQVLAENLTKHHKQFQEIAVYESRDIGAANPQVLKQLESGQIDWIILTSPAIANNCLKLFGERIQQVRIATISNSVSKIVIEHGFSVSAEAIKPGFAELIQAMKNQTAS